MRASRGRTASRPYASARRSARNRDDGSTALPTPLPGVIGNCRRGVQGCRRSAGMLRAVPSEHRSELSVGSALLCVARCSDFMRRLPFVRPPPCRLQPTGGGSCRSDSWLPPSQGGDMQAPAAAVGAQVPGRPERLYLFSDRRKMGMRFRRCPTDRRLAAMPAR